MEKHNLDNQSIVDINYFLNQDIININNSEHIITLLKNSLESIKDKLILEDISILINNLNTFSKIIDEKYYKKIEIIQLYLENNYLVWLIDIIDDNIEIDIDGKQVHYKSIIKNIEYLRDISLNNLDKQTYEKINFSIKLLIIFFKDNKYLEKNEEDSFLYLDKYITNPIINNSDNIKEILQNIKAQLLPNNNNSSDKLSQEIEIQVKNEIIEKIEGKLPEIINNLYIYFSKLFNRKRILIEQNEIKSLKRLFELSEKYIIDNEQLFGDLILEQFQNLSKHINDLDIESNKQFKEDKIKTYFDNLIMISNEISNIYEKKK